jgi:hypothetical protein
MRVPVLNIASALDKLTFTGSTSAFPNPVLKRPGFHYLPS